MTSSLEAIGLPAAILKSAGTVQAANEVMHFYKDDLRLADELASCELLAKNWVKRLRKRLRGQESGIDRRVFGPNKE